jgi:hypothetical protein
MLVYVGLMEGTQDLTGLMQRSKLYWKLPGTVSLEQVLRTTSNMLLDFHRVGHFDSLEGNMSHRKATFISKYIYIVYYPSFVVGSP